METKTVRVSLEMHKAVHDLADRINGTADDAIRHLLDENTIRVPVTTAQRKRWQEYADASGVSIARFIMMRIEAALQYGMDPGTMHLAMDHLRAIARHMGVKVRPTQPRRPGDDE
ncbi:hypothetical protein [Streptomyces sp. NPDC087787]|uniref:hypothetical protein n=1 Tax=Streptomyces sp. NPDC087787 TaxID=3365803 RepID=UPI00381117B8